MPYMATRSDQAPAAAADLTHAAKASSFGIVSIPASTGPAMTVPMLLGSAPGASSAEDDPDNVVALPGASPDTVRASEEQAAEAALQALLTSGDILEPPSPGLEQLIEWIQKSSIIGQCIDAVATNQGGFGLDLVPAFPDPDAPPPGAEEQLERAELFFATVAGRHTLEEVRYNRDWDREGIGNGYLEWLTTVGGELAGVQHVRAQHIRLCRLSTPVVFDRQWMNPRTGKQHTVPRAMRFRRFVRLVDMQRPIFFKELGDPRYLDKFTGRYSDTPIPVDRQATALSHSLRYHPGCEYGFPVWARQDAEVRSSREFMELLVRWFETGGIGLWLIAASNGAVRNKDALEQKLNELRGSRRAFGALFADAVAGDTESLVKELGRGGKDANTVSVHNLTSALSHEVILQFTEKIRPIIRSAWRLAPTYTGEAQEYSKASVITSQAVTEEQVFEPLRRVDDAFFNQLVLPMIGVHHYRAKTRGAQTSDNIETAKAVSPYLPMLTYSAVVRVLKDTAGVELQVPDEPWVNVPLEILRARMAKGGDINAPVGEGDFGSEEVVAKSALRGDVFYQHVLDALRSPAAA